MNDDDKMIGYDFDAEDSSISSAQDANEVDDKVKLTEALNKMPEKNRRRFLKLMQINTLKSALSAVEGGKNTSEKEWKTAISKLYGIKDMDSGEKSSKFDWKSFVDKILPMLGMLAGLFLALRAAEKAEIEAAEPEEPDPNSDDQSSKDITTAAKAAEECAKIAADNIRKSVVLQMCELKENGFSFNG